MAAAAGAGASAAATAGAGASAGLTWPAARVRETFVRYFVEKCGHVNYVSSPCVPHDDPTLLFANSGMCQFKPVFLGRADPSGPLASLKRAANSQKCIRAGGKHNDLDDVGKDTYHHTFFEMLGNWSFGDYFKAEAIEWAWKLLTEEFGLPKDRLYASYFAGDPSSDPPLAEDIEAKTIWLKFLPESRILPFDKKANFWEMGDTGPCGPCSEIHFDRIGGRDASALVNKDDPTVIEIWNIVFMQFSREPDRTLRELPAKHIDTGMGFERLTSCLQDKMSNYDTDVFQPLFDAIQRITGAAPYEGKLGAEDAESKDMAYRVIADHARTLTFAITDGAVPSNEGRGYVLRRILRRAVRYGQQMLKAPAGILLLLVPVVVANFKDAFPELAGKESFVVEVVKDEEDSFNRTLSQGIKHFNVFAKRAKDAGLNVLPGADAFFLYDSMGFPLDLTQIMASEVGMTVDTEGYEKAMADQKARSQASSKFARDHDKLVFEAEQTSWLTKAGIAYTNDAAKYDSDATPAATIKAIYVGGKVNSGFLEAATPATSDLTVVGIVMDATSFYAESGGQASDTGVLTLLAAGEDAATVGATAAGGAGAGAGAGALGGDAATGRVHVDVHDVQVFGGFVLHIGTVRKPEGGGSAALKVGDRVRCEVDYSRRALIAPNHTMTHVLNFALREVLGAGADQRGSTVAADKLRFDFAANKGLTADQLERVEGIVNEEIAKALPVYTQVVPLPSAMSVRTLRAVFGETYPDPVRVVSVGAPVTDLLADPENAKWMLASVELCGGTHVKNTSAAGQFAIIEESAISKGVRRIIAVTREAAVAAHDRAAELRGDVASARSLSGAALGKRQDELRKAVDEAVIPQFAKMRLREAMDELGKRVVAEAKAASARLLDAGKAAALAAVAAGAAAGKKSVVADLPLDGDGGHGRVILAAVKEANPEIAFLGITSDGEGKVAVFAGTPPAAVAPGLKAIDWVNATCGAGGGRGGGKDDVAQGNCKDASKFGAMLAAANAFFAGKY